MELHPKYKILLNNVNYKIILNIVILNPMVK